MKGMIKVKSVINVLFVVVLLMLLCKSVFRLVCFIMCISVICRVIVLINKRMMFENRCSSFECGKVFLVKML